MMNGVTEISQDMLVLWKKSLNSDGQQFHQYIYKKIRTITSHLNRCNTKKTMTQFNYYIGNPGSGLGQTQKCGGVNPVNGS